MRPILVQQCFHDLHRNVEFLNTFKAFISLRLLDLTHNLVLIYDKDTCNLGSLDIGVKLKRHYASVEVVNF